MAKRTEAGEISNFFHTLTVGDRVNVTGPYFNGPGIVTEKTTEDPHGTPLYPGFHVHMDSGEDLWLAGTSLRRI